MADQRSILIVDDTPANLDVLVDALTDAGYQVLVARDVEHALERLRHVRPDIILLGEASNLHLRQEVRERERAEGRLQQTNDELEQRVAARTAELEAALAQVEELKNRLEAENVYLQQEIQLSHNFEDIVTQSPALVDVLEQVEQVARTDATVLILGETGTGKELIARAVHSASPRRDRPLVKVNCAALPANLIESELFGHERGAFTGAFDRKPGRFELARGGTIFLDEIGDLPLGLQVSLLRVLQEGTFERVGGSKTLEADARVIAATNCDLGRAVTEGGFREDLYYRLYVFPIHCPPLRDRKEDIPLLVRHFVDKHGARIGKRIDTIPAGLVEALQAYDWPGNVRELENVIERAVVLSPKQRLELRDWLPGTSEQTTEPHPLATLDQNEREHIEHVLRMTRGRIRGKGGAAQLLGIKPTTLDGRIKKLGIEKRK